MARFNQEILRVQDDGTLLGGQPALNFTGPGVIVSEDPANGRVDINILTGATLATGWQDDGTIVRLVAGTDRVGIGTATPNAARKVEIANEATRLGLRVTAAVAGENALDVFVAGEANASVDIRPNSIRLGPGGATALDVEVSRGAANRLDVATGDSLNLVLGDLMIAAVSVINSARNIVGVNALAQALAADADNTRALGTAALRYSDLVAVQYRVFAAAADANPSAVIASNSIQLGPGGPAPADVALSRGAANRLDLATGDNFNLVLGDLMIAAVSVINSARNIVGVNALAQALTADADNTRALGTAALRYSDLAAVQYRVFGAAGDANPTTRIGSGAIDFGAGGAGAVDVSLSRGAANRLDLATGDSLNLVSGDMQIGAVTVIDSLRTLVGIALLGQSLTPNADNSFSLGTAAQRLVNVDAISHRVFAAAGDANASAILASNSLRLGPGGATAPDVELARLGANELAVAAGDTLVIQTNNGMNFINQTTAAGAAAGTIANAPAAGNPTWWLRVQVAGVNLAVPCWSIP